MFATRLGYVSVILVQQALIVGMLWYVMHLLDKAKRERRRHDSTLLFTKVAASCDLASLAARLSKFGDVQLGPAGASPRMQIRQQEQA